MLSVTPHSLQLKYRKMGISPFRLLPLPPAMGSALSLAACTTHDICTRIPVTSAFGISTRSLIELFQYENFLSSWDILFLFLPSAVGVRGHAGRHTHEWTWMYSSKFIFIATGSRLGLAQGHSLQTSPLNVPLIFFYLFYF